MQFRKDRIVKKAFPRPWRKGLNFKKGIEV